MTDRDVALRAVDPALVARARQLGTDGTRPETPRHSSTTVLLRDGPDGLEVYVLRRRTTMAAAAGMYAFPGGGLDRADVTDGVAWAGPAPAEWARRLGLADARMAQGSVCAAVRETFEEAGVLLAGPTADTVVADTTDEASEGERLSLVGRTTSLADMLDRHGLVLRADLLVPWAHWVTPRVYARRFDTRFFLAALPAGQRTRDVSAESDRVAWSRPRDILAAVDRDEMRMLPPTYVTVQALVPHRTVADAMAAAAERTIRPVMPAVVLDGDDGRWVFPDEPGHDGEWDEGEVR